MKTRNMKHRIVGLFGIFIPMTIIGSLVTTTPCQKAQVPVAPEAPIKVARPNASDVKTVDCAKAEVKKTGDVCQEEADAV